ncbi:MAG: DUF89 family protein [Actinophytocola sp.]|uniref:damage-control phosphatase ARMT1 family protein n=1 Tax=Actinophytocola sp. TaxID=1872138 RepID=UPI0013263B95|nr:damage-control phosphatase ARMT1 family protein [Actinophytocola sp.]MPZ81699.1 DUF89 family protein [Actinophytocola sp.]
MTDRLPDAPPILGDPPGSFAWDVLHRRHPALIEQVRGGLPYPPDRLRALDALTEEITGVIEPLDRDAHDRATWDAWGAEYVGRPWPAVPFLWAESYFYRRLLGAVGYFGPGPWRGIDPFEPAKSAELADPALDVDLAALDELPGLPADELVAALTGASLWGNRADLGFRIGAAPTEANEDLVVDQRPRLWSLLAAARTVCVVADNAGRELLPDLLLIDHLLAAGGVARVALHVKPHPYYVSDATMSDVIAALRRLGGAPGYAAAVGERLRRAVGAGRLTVSAPDFYRAPWSFHRMPADLAAEFAAASLTVVKGDLNYRRLVGDRAWPATTPFEAVTAYFPGPVATLRTLKCDVVTGVPAETLAALDGTGEPWRTNGTRALVQVRG